MPKPARRPIVFTPDSNVKIEEVEVAVWPSEEPGKIPFLLLCLTLREIQLNSNKMVLQSNNGTGPVFFYRNSSVAKDSNMYQPKAWVIASADGFFWSDHKKGTIDYDITIDLSIGDRDVINDFLAKTVG